MRIRIPTITLNNKIDIPVIGLGTWKSKGNETYNIVKEALLMGFRHIDCAAFYQNEKEIGNAIRECINNEKSGIKREQLYITSKLWNTKHRPECVEAACKESLKDLSLDYLDLYLMHWPMAYKEGPALVPIDNRRKVLYSSVKYVDTWKAMEELVKNNLTKSIAVCNFNKRQIETLLKDATIKPVINQVECHPFLNQSNLKNFCNKNDIQITCFSPLGSRDRPWAKRGEAAVLDNEVILRLSKKYKKSQAQIVLRYQFQRGNISIPKTARKERLSENANIFDYTLKQEDMELIDSLNINYRYIADRDHPDYPFRDPF
ncbi:hypothetical protein RN001_013955 [Aquatica leii]|uniref:NADP-dependent oxidoreductase domain-containing protein n=1 Tax=Aquatica leii TaxID=1421715 RepID=A0AAN7Q0B4_9COLE|nr:hypothetical protein RN001_013955 [Aquatica leii]